METLTNNEQNQGSLDLEPESLSEDEMIAQIEGIQNIQDIETLKPDRIHDELRTKLFLYNSSQNDYARPLSMEDEPTPSPEEIHMLAMELAAITLKSDELDGRQATIKDETGYSFPPTTGTTDLVLEAYDLLDKDEELAEYAAKMLPHLHVDAREVRGAALQESLESDISYSEAVTKRLAEIDYKIDKQASYLGKKALFNDLANPNYHPYSNSNGETRLVDREDMVIVPSEAEEYVNRKNIQAAETSMPMSPAEMFGDDDED